jgi:hypothetical protein
VNLSASWAYELNTSVGDNESAVATYSFGILKDGAYLFGDSDRCSGNCHKPGPDDPDHAGYAAAFLLAPGDMIAITLSAPTAFTEVNTPVGGAPEPASVALMVIGAIAVLSRRRPPRA